MELSHEPFHLTLGRVLLTERQGITVFIAYKTHRESGTDMNAKHKPPARGYTQAQTSASATASRLCSRAARPRCVAVGVHGWHDNVLPLPTRFSTQIGCSRPAVPPCRLLWGTPGTAGAVPNPGTRKSFNAFIPREATFLEFYSFWVNPLPKRIEGFGVGGDFDL